MTQVWPPTQELRGTPKSKLLLGCTRPPEVMMGRYSISWEPRANRLWFGEIW